MTPADLPTFLSRLLALAEVYDVTLSASKQDSYISFLEDLQLNEVVSALNRAGRTLKYFPRPAEIRELVLGTPEDQTEAAWLRLRHEMRRVGGYADPTFGDDQALAAAVREVFGTWEAACWTDYTPEMLASKRKEFGRVYALCRRSPASLPTVRLRGLLAREAEERGEQSTALSTREGERHQ